MKKKKLELEIIQILKKIKKKTKISLDQSLTEQGFDSIDFLSMISALQSKYNSLIDNKFLNKFSEKPTIKNIVKILEKKLNKTNNLMKNLKI